jgi:hypothetical protein
MATDPSALPPDAQPPVAAAPPPSTIHEAELGSGGSGRILYGAEIDLNVAVARRKVGENVVVCGHELKVNRRLAQLIEKTVGPHERGEPHLQTAGPQALPHFQQQDPTHLGHTFYETPNRRASRRKR